MRLNELQTYAKQEFLVVEDEEQILISARALHELLGIKKSGPMSIKSTN